VVGRASFPSLADRLSLGDGAGFTLAGLRSGLPPDVAPPTDTMLVRFKHDVARDAAIDRLSEHVSAACACAIMRPSEPVDLVNFGRVEYFPAVLTGVIGGLGALTLAHLLVSSTRRRRRDLAVLQVLGFVPAQVRRAVGWQATTVVLVAAVFGVPLGVAAGRAAWTRFADQLGVAAPPVVPALAVLVAMPLAALLIANAAALLPARAAVRSSPGHTLHEE
jgi:predicted lysophospholipase L1 biosynthesis ABC-type transport system permease subunit